MLRPTDDLAAATADALQTILRARGLSVALIRPRATTSSHVAVASPSAALAALQDSAIKLDRLSALVIDGASAMIELEAGEVLETLTAQVPHEAQRVLLTSALTHEVENWIDRHARRARRLVYLPAEPAPLSEVSAEFYCAPRPLWLPVLSGLLSGISARSVRPVVVRCRLQSEAEQLADQLAVRGVPVSAASDTTGVRIDWEDTADLASGAISLFWGTPPDVESFRARVAHAARAAVFLEPRELPHLQRLAGLLAIRLAALRTALPADALRSAQLTRERLRDAATKRDLEPYALLLEPLLDEFTPLQLAAAATALLRDHAPAPAKPPLPAWTRLYFGVGRRDGVRPADLVGAITGESSLTGDKVGRIEIRDTHSMVEVAAAVADRVIKSLATATIRGRPANVRVFRE